MIERSLLAVRRDQSRRRPGPPWAEGAPGHGPWGHGGHGPYGGHGWGPSGPWAYRHGAAEESGGAEPDADRGRRGAEPAEGPTPEGDDRTDRADSADPTAPRAPQPSWPGHGFPAFGDSARPGPGRRARDGSLGRIARVRMLEALEAADARGDHLSVSTLAASIGVDQPRASRLVQDGVERGMVRRVPDPSDARRALIELTAAGRRQLEELRSHRRSAVEAALAEFTPEEARTFAELFDRFVRAWPRP